MREILAEKCEWSTSTAVRLDLPHGVGGLGNESRFDPIAAARSVSKRPPAQSLVRCYPKLCQQVNRLLPAPQPRRHPGTRPGCQGTCAPSPSAPHEEERPDAPPTAPANGGSCGCLLPGDPVLSKLSEAPCLLPAGSSAGLCCPSPGTAVRSGQAGDRAHPSRRSGRQRVPRLAGGKSAPVWWSSSSWWRGGSRRRRSDPPRSKPGPH